jgi:hypothetical protein
VIFDAIFDRPGRHTVDYWAVAGPSFLPALSKGPNRSGVGTREPSEHLLSACGTDEAVIL